MADGRSPNEWIEAYGFYCTSCRYGRYGEPLRWRSEQLCCSCVRAILAGEQPPSVDGLPMGIGDSNRHELALEFWGERWWHVMRPRKENSMLVAAMTLPGEDFPRILVDKTPKQIGAYVGMIVPDGESLMITLKNGGRMQAFLWRDGVFYHRKDGLFVDIDAWIRQTTPVGVKTELGGLDPASLQAIADPLAESTP